MRSKPVLRLRADGTFTMVQFTDTHWQNGEPRDEQTRALIESVLEAEQPDLVLLTGDVIDGRAASHPAHSWLAVVAPMETRGIPWAAVFGNHDDEGPLDRRQAMAVQQSCAQCLSAAGPAEVSGVSNYVLCVRSAGRELPALVLYCIDSNGYAEPAVGGYGWIHRDQIAWYLRMARRIRGDHGMAIPALAFFHIPLPEFEEVWHLSTCRGHKHEAVCCPRINSGFFAAARQAGALMGIFVGHDHVNDFEGELSGIRLCYGRASGYQTYGRAGFAQGARVIRYREGEMTFRSWLRLADGVVVTDPPRHEPEGAGNLPAVP